MDQEQLGRLQSMRKGRTPDRADWRESAGPQNPDAWEIRRSHNHLKQSAIRRIKTIKHMVLSISDYFDIDCVLQLAVSWISQPWFGC